MKNNIIILLFFKYFFIWSMMLHYSISKILDDYYLHQKYLNNLNVAVIFTNIFSQGMKVLMLPNGNDMEDDRECKMYICTF